MYQGYEHAVIDGIFFVELVAGDVVKIIKWLKMIIDMQGY